MLLAVWALTALSAAAKLPFVFNGTGMTVLEAHVAELDEDTGTFEITITATNDETPIYNVNGGYFTTLRSYFTGGRKRPNAEESAMPLCKAIHGGCPVPGNGTFTFSFNASLGRPISFIEDVHVFISISETNRPLGAIDMQLTREIGLAYQLGFGVVIPLCFILLALIKYFLVIWLDPEPVSSWNPFIIRNSGANELAALGSATQIFRYFQFIAFTAIVDVQYPAYYQSLLGRIGWVIGIFPNNWVSGRTAPETGTDGLASLAGYSQLESQMYFSQLPTVADLWPGNAITFAAMLGVFICAAIARWRSKYRWTHAFASVTHVWFSVTALPLLFVCFTSFMYLNPSSLKSTGFYTPDGEGFNPSQFCEELPYAFPLSYSFYYTHSSPGVIFSMALYICLWLAAVAYFGVKMYQARKKGYISRESMVLWGRYFQSARSDLWYHVLQFLFIVVQAITFSVLSTRSLTQCVIWIVCQLVQLASLYGIRPAELSQVGICLMMVPTVSSVATCCLLFPLCPTIIKSFPYLLKPYYSNRIMFGIIIIQGLVLVYFILINILAICLTAWRHFRFVPKPLQNTATFSNQGYIATEVYYRKPRNQPEVQEIEYQEDDTVSRNYTTREVDNIYGINGTVPHPSDCEVIPFAPDQKQPKKPSFISKMFRPSQRPPPSGFEVIRRSYPPLAPESPTKSLNGCTSSTIS